MQAKPVLLCVHATRQRRSDIAAYRRSDPADNGDPFGFEKKPKYKHKTKKMKCGMELVYGVQFVMPALLLEGVRSDQRIKNRIKIDID